MIGGERKEGGLRLILKWCFLPGIFSFSAIAFSVVVFFAVILCGSVLTCCLIVVIFFVVVRSVLGSCHFSVVGFTVVFLTFTGIVYGKLGLLSTNCRQW